jgi:hypothetical protein
MPGMKKNILLILASLLYLQCFSQKLSRDTCTNIFSISASYGYFMPGGNLKDRFGNNSTIGAALLYKTPKNWLIGLDWNYIFGDNINEDTILNNISTSQGFVIDGNGRPAMISLYERGFLTSVKFGKLICLNSKNPNSGFVLLGSAGFLQHKIRIQNTDGAAVQIRGDYKKGYDRLTNGLSVSEYIGYMYYGKKNILNVYGGFELTQAWTQNRRSLNFDTQSRDLTKRLDLLYGVKIGWMVPFYSRKTQKYYYN